MTISASIPAAVLSMLIFRMFRSNANILENNIVQTIASAGEASAAALIFTIPALLITGAWPGVSYWGTFVICLLGGALGILFLVPLRRVIVVNQAKDKGGPLGFPEAKACAAILEAGQKGVIDKSILWAAALGVIFKLGSTVLVFLKESVAYGFNIFGGAGAVGMDVSAALAAVGVIVGRNAAFVMVIGGLGVFLGVIPWWLASNGIDIAAFMKTNELSNLADVAGTVWSKHGRYVGVGAMVVAGAASLWGLRKELWSAIMTLVSRKAGSDATQDSTDQDLGGNTLRILIIVIVGAIISYYFYATGHVVLAIVVGPVMIVAGFLFTAVAAYMSGLVGASNNPVSGMTLCTILVTGLLVVFFGFKGAEGIMATLIVAAFVCTAAAMSGDVSQDLRTGLLVKGTPWRMQVGGLLGVVVSQLCCPGYSCSYMRPMVSEWRPTSEPLPEVRPRCHARKGHSGDLRAGRTQHGYGTDRHCGRGLRRSDRLVAQDG